MREDEVGSICCCFQGENMTSFLFLLLLCYVILLLCLLCLFFLSLLSFSFFLFLFLSDLSSPTTHLAQVDREVDHGDIDHGNAHGHAGELAVEIRDDFAHSLGRTRRAAGRAG